MLQDLELLSPLQLTACLRFAKFTPQGGVERNASDTTQTRRALAEIVIKEVTGNDP